MICIICAMAIIGALCTATGGIGINLIYAAAINREAYSNQSFMPATQVIAMTRASNILFFDIGLIVAGILILSLSLYFGFKYMSNTR
ncbi:hypothetical protein [Oscillibacter sp.]|uniref:hypothetical protein n=1 Tax=Oscillibacter sp. TaxID=1945593 RepID=UPI00289742BF|nr:hypothetical protein [Oscillibacter sp.]